MKRFPAVHSMSPASPVWFLTGIVLFFALKRSSTAEATKPVVAIAIRQIDFQEAAKASYTQNIKPLLEEHCSECHSGDEHKGGFDASSVPNLVKGGKKASPAIIPGKPDESAVVQYLRGQREPQMPKGNQKLSADELHLIRSWIAAGRRMTPQHRWQAVMEMALVP
jgi:mono/diheme cytochrome c family protein